MFRPNGLLQFLLGISITLLSAGASWSMINGQRIKIKAIGASLSVGEGLNQVENVTENLQKEILTLKSDRSIPSEKLQNLEQGLDQASEQLLKAKSDLKEQQESFFEETILPEGID